VRPEELTGHWWLPESPERQVAGTLTYEPDGYPELNLMGTLSEAEPDLADTVALGLTSDGEPVTVEADFELSHRVTTVFAGVQVLSQTIAVRRAIVGAHLIAPEDRRYSELILELTDIRPWAGWPPPVLRHPSADEVSINYMQPAELRADVDWGSIRLRGTWRSEGDNSSFRKITVGAGFLCERREPEAIETWLDEVVAPLRDFVSLATDRANQVTDVRVKPVHEEGYSRLIYPAMAVEVPPGTAVSHEFPFTALAVDDEFQRLCARWLEVRRRQRRAIALYLATQYRPSELPETRFLNITSAAEAYHRRASGPDIARSENHKEQVHRIDAALVASGLARRDLALVRWRLRHVDEPTLEDRVSSLARRCGTVLQPHVDDATALGRRVAAARNSLIHNDPSRNADPPSGREIVYLFEDLALILLVCLYQDLGFDDDRIKRMLQPTRRLRLFELRKTARTP
jgi:hypothetical protein